MNKMSFKKVALASLVAASALMSSMVQAEDNDTIAVTMTGLVEAAPCTVQLSNNVLDLGSPLASDLKISSEAPLSTILHPLRISITECANYAGAEINVLGTADSADTTVLANSAESNKAENVGVGVWEHNKGTQLKIGGEALATTATMTDLDFAFVKTGASSVVTAGDVTTAAQVKVTFL
jgi:type 1 fimbria pilin